MIGMMQLRALPTWFTGTRRKASVAFVVCWFVLRLAQGAYADVRINEFLADNQDGLRTQAGEAADWIELFNDSSQEVDLGGWYLTDNASTPTEWRFPEGTTIPANGYLIIFADSSTTSITNGELHASFSLSKDGEYLGLYLPDGVTVASEFVPNFPGQFSDVSYGRGRPREHELVGSTTASRYRIPNSTGTAPWMQGSGSLGFTGTNGTFTVKYYEMNSAIGSVDAAESMVANNSYWNTDRAYPLIEQHDTIDFHANSGSGVFTYNRLFPGHTFAGEDRERFVLVIEGAIYVPSAGMWTFAVGSDDGFRLNIGGHGVQFVSEYTTGRGFDTTLATFNFPVAGIYDLRLIYYENGGGASVEFSVAQDFQSSFSADIFQLTGNPAGGILHAGAIGSLVDTDVLESMKNVNARLDAEWSFTLESQPAAEDTFTLYVRCADGFSATLNGTPVAELNVPVPLVWNSAATKTRSLEETVQWLAYSIPSSLFKSGNNTLAITALNNSAADQDFLIGPRLGWHPGQNLAAYFKTPTPGAANAESYTAPTPMVAASEPRGYKTTPFTVSLSCPDPGAEIRYT